MKKLGIVLLLPACLQQGLVSDPNALTTTPPPSSNSGKTAQIEMTKKSGQFLKTVFGTKSYTGSVIQGYNRGTMGETFCLSNENEPNGSSFDSLVNCRRPLGTNPLSSEEEEVLDALTAENGSTSARGLGFILQAVQFYFSNTLTPPDDKYYSQINQSSLKVSIKTAPIKFNEDTGEYTWDSNFIESYKYHSSSELCNHNDPNSVGFDIQEDTSLGTRSERSKYFVTGLWVFERSEMKPYETNHVAPIGTYSSGGSAAGSGPSQLFATRVNVFASLLIPQYDPSSRLFSPLFLPGADSFDSKAASAEAAPFKYTFGMYRQNTVSQVLSSLVAGEDGTASLGSTEGAILTPVMGRYNQSGQVVTASNAGVGWEGRAIIGLCISGTRKIYEGKNTDGSAKEHGTFPVVHALKYELRKIKSVYK